MVLVEVAEESLFWLSEVLVVEEAFLLELGGVAVGRGVELAELLGLHEVLLLFRFVLAGDEGDSAFVVLALLLGLGLGQLGGLEEPKSLLQFALFALAERIGH